MDATAQYAIRWKGLKNGTYHFDYKVDGSLFETFESTEIKDGDLNVSVTAERTDNQLSLQVAIRGTVTVACDRCLELYRQPIEFDGRLLVRFSDEAHDYDGEVLWLTPGETEVSLAQYIYESIVLMLPYQRVHPEGGCDPDMLQRFRIVSEEEFDAIEQRAESHAPAMQPLDNESLARLSSLREQLGDESEEDAGKD
ncbi:DUF177 domain-containing protein [uncultured Alistipes sp.]|uniref:YceD family protein n=1 Tax=uncultured Alistipes sp. TaxID=538949 RepID=UPI00260E13A7|nr:DUF177 domain-containing protein [uncultured Alistipes sp.]